MLKVVHDESQPNEHAPAAVGGSLLDELARDGARLMLAAALQAEVAAYIDAHAHLVDEHGHRLVVRNGHHQPREVVTAAGAVPVRQPRVNDRRNEEATGARCRFSSAILPAWARKSPQVAEVLPLLYLHGMSTGDFVPALEQFLGSSAGLSPATITRLVAQWQDEANEFAKRSLADTDYVYLWVDGIHLKVRLEQDKVCLLVMIGVRVDGRKELVAVVLEQDPAAVRAAIRRARRRERWWVTVLLPPSVVVAALVLFNQFGDLPDLFGLGPTGTWVVAITLGVLAAGAAIAYWWLTMRGLDAVTLAHVTVAGAELPDIDSVTDAAAVATGLSTGILTVRVHAEWRLVNRALEPVPHPDERSLGASGRQAANLGEDEDAVLLCAGGSVLGRLSDFTPQ